MLRQIYAHMGYLEGQIAAIDAEIGQSLSCDKDLIALLCEIPGVDEKSATQILSEIGTDMAPFASEKHLASWAGISPGNNESAGKKKWAHRTRQQTT